MRGVRLITAEGLDGVDRSRGLPAFKRVVPVRELNEAFTPTADEVAWAVDRSLGDSNLLSLGSDPNP